MADSYTRRIIASYMEEASAPMFLTGFFATPDRNFHNSELIEIDVWRDSEEVAIAIQDLSAGARQNELGPYTNKAFPPPIFDEEGTINSYDLIKRPFDASAFDDPDIQAQAVVRSFAIYRRLENKIRRAVELQAAQVLTTGKVTLRDPANNTIFSLDFQPRSAHFPTVVTSWADTTNANPFGDIAALAGVLRKNGRRNPNRLIMGSAAAANFIANKKIREQLNIIGLQGLAQVTPDTRGEGGSFMGRFFIGQNWFEVWVYEGDYKDPVTGNMTPYLDPNTVIMLASTARLECSFGAIPRIVAPDPRVTRFLPSRMSDGERGLDLSTFAWITPDGKHLKVSCGTRPLCIPVGIDQFGALKTVP